MEHISDITIREEIMRLKGDGTWHDLSQKLGYSPTFLNLVYLEQRKIPVTLAAKLGFQRVWIKEEA